LSHFIVVLSVKLQAGWIEDIVVKLTERRCLFAALKIHVSQQCKRLLDKLGGYETTKRGFVNVKVSITCSVQFTSLLNSSQSSLNSWLLDRQCSAVNVTLWRPLLPCGYSNASCVGLG